MIDTPHLSPEQAKVVRFVETRIRRLNRLLKGLGFEVKLVRERQDLLDISHTIHNPLF